MKTIEATYRIVTPMFIGGADGSPTDGIRPPSFKGALRFWWRALNWGKYQNLTKLHEKEAELFGSAAKKVDGEQVGGQGKFLLTMKELGIRKTINDWPKANTGAGYLAYGIVDSKGGKRGTPVPHKIGIMEGLRFTVTLRFHPTAKEEDIKSIEGALNVMGLLGGLGSRNRRGHGSIAREDQGNLLGLSEYKEQLKGIFNSTASIAKYSTFNKASLLKVLTPSHDPRQALNAAGQRYKDYRGSIVDQKNKRISFGLPLQGVDEKTRRASPLFFHVHAISDKQFVSIAFTMPATDFHYADTYKNINHASIDTFMEQLS